MLIKQLHKSMQNFNFDREVKVVIIIINYFDPVRDGRSDKQSLIKLGNEGKMFSVEGEFVQRHLLRKSMEKWRH